MDNYNDDSGRTTPSMPLTASNQNKSWSEYAKENKGMIAIIIIIIVAAIWYFFIKKKDGSEGSTGTNVNQGSTNKLTVTRMRGSAGY